jgi:phospholipid/cholesterol/gamma-HCH transport system substrate-binding protein
MQKDAPNVARILTMVIFALSCFGLLLFLWLSFGGPIPLQPEGYRFQAAFDEAPTLAEEADVRIAGVNVGKVKTKALDKRGARTNVDIELEDQHSPIPNNTRAILRQKTLLGETYIELTPGNPETGMLAEGAKLSSTQVEDTVELDEILRIFDPETRKAFRGWVAEQNVAISGGTSQDLNDALGNLPEFFGSGSEVLQVLDEQDRVVSRLIANTGRVFGALNEQDGALRELIVNSNNTFEATASEKEALAETIQVFPSFLRESRLTLARLEDFSLDTRPLVNDLKPVADDLGPTVRDLGDLSPDLRDVFQDFPPLIRSGDRTLPQAARFLRGARPVFEGLHTFLPELNPVLSFGNYHRGGIADFISVGGGALNLGLPNEGGEPSEVHLLSQASPIGSNSDHFDRTEAREEFRGNAYNAPGNLARAAFEGAIPSFTCYNNGGEQERASREGERPNEPPCVLQGPYGFDGSGRFPQIRGRQEPLEGSGRVPRPKPFPAPGRGQVDSDNKR